MRETELEPKLIKLSRTSFLFRTFLMMKKITAKTSVKISWSDSRRKFALAKVELIFGYSRTLILTASKWFTIHGIVF